MPAIQALRPIAAWPPHFLTIGFLLMGWGLVFAFPTATVMAQHAIFDASASEAAVELPDAVQAESEDELENATVAKYLPGLVGRYQLNAQTLTRLDTEIHFVGSPNSDNPSYRIDDRFPQQAFEVQWSGAIDSKETGAYRLSAFVCGRFQLSIAGQ